MEIYYLKWSGTGSAPVGGAAYYDKERAEHSATYANTKLPWWRRKLMCHRWFVSTLDLKGKEIK